jgi:hypothetical protein
VDGCQPAACLFLAATAFNLRLLLTHKLWELVTGDIISTFFLVLYAGHSTRIIIFGIWSPCCSTIVSSL